MKPKFCRNCGQTLQSNLCNSCAGYTPDLSKRANRKVSESFWRKLLMEYFSLNGRLSRREYFRLNMGVVVFTLINIVVASIMVRNEVAFTDGMAFVEATANVFFASFFLRIPISARRLHDLNKSMSSLFIYLVPIIGALWLEYLLFFKKGVEGANKYGVDPLGKVTEQDILEENERFCPQCGMFLPDTDTCPACIRSYMSDSYSFSQELKEKLFSLKGRISRKTYLSRNLILLIVEYFVQSILLMIASFIILPNQQPNIVFFSGLIILAVIFVLIVSVSHFTLLYRRLHDLNKSAWFMLLYVIPVFNVIIALYALFGKGMESANRYGSEPLDDADDF